MANVRPVLLVSSGGLTTIASRLRAFGIGALPVHSVEDALARLEHFRVDAVVAVGLPAEQLEPLRRGLAPLVVLDAEGPDALARYLNAPAVVAALIDNAIEQARSARNQGAA